MSSTKEQLEELWPSAQEILGLLKTHARENGGKIPQKYYEAFPHLFPQACIELVIARYTEFGKVIYMVQRPESDMYWPGELHVPGTTLYPFDSKEQMWERVLADELDGKLMREDFKLTSVYVSTYGERERGACQHAIYLAIIDDDVLPEEDFYPIEDLPENVIHHHRLMLETIVDHF